MSANPYKVPGLQTAIEQSVAVSQGKPLAPTHGSVIKWTAAQTASKEKARAELDKWFGKRE